MYLTHRQIRDMAAVFVSRADLLPPGETLEEHKKWQQEDADAVQKDRDNTDPRTGGLFKGLFNAPAHPLRPSLHIVRDREDGVDRCPICAWELEDGGCTQCGLVFDETGEVSWDNSFTGFSDMDEMSEQDADDLDAAMGFEEGEFDGFGDPMDGWQDYMGDPGAGFVMRRFLQHNNAGPRRHLSHSEAGSRRSYSQSIISDVYGDEMDTVEEEDEEEDSEMNDFIDDAAQESSASASGASSTPGQTPQPPANRPRPRARARPVVEESETSSTISSVVEEEEEQEEDEETEEDAGPVRRGQRPQAQRPRAQNGVLNRANGTRSRFARVVAPSSSASTDASTEELDEDERALLEEEGWMRQTDDDEMDEEDGDSDGGATTVGWEPLANSNDRSRMGGSLTPTADRPRPSAPIRPPSRVGNVRALDASRGLRRRSSVLSNANPHYEDGEADDDDSDQDGDLSMAMHSLRSRRSQQTMRNGPAFQTFQNRFTSNPSATNEADTDDNSDNSQAGPGRRTARIQRREYDPRISWMFAAHQAQLQQHQMGGNLIDIESRSITPLNRPPTSNRNRQSPAPASFSPFLPPARMRTPLMDNGNFGLRIMPSPNRRSAMSPVLPPANVMDSALRNDRTPSVSSASNDSVILTPGSSVAGSQHSLDQTIRTQAAAAMDMIDRPQSRISARPPSAAGRRGSANYSPVYQNFPNPNMNMHAPASAVPARPANPWAAYVSRSIRARNSRLGLREQSSTATLRPTSSRANIRENPAPSPVMRTQTSRIGLRPQPSVRRLSAQPSTRALRAPPSPGPNVQMASPSMARVPMGLTPDDVTARARELRNNREQALGLSTNVPARTNPFSSGFRRPSAGNMPPMTQGHVRSNSNESMGSVNSAGTAHDGSAGPVLGRRRSNRNMMNAPPPGVLPSSEAFASPVTAYANNAYRSRQGNSIGPLATFESPAQHNNRTARPATTGQLI